PSSMSASSSVQLLKVVGQNFQTGSHLIFHDPSGNPYSSADHPDRVVTVTSTEFDYNINNGGAVGTWTVELVNPDNQASNIVSFEVVTPDAGDPIGIAVTPRSIEFSLRGESVPLDVRFMFSNGSTVPVNDQAQFTIRDPDIASVTSSSVVT